MRNTKRIMDKRLRIVKDEWCFELHGFKEEHPWLKQPNRVNKYNLRCGCRMCRIRDMHPRKEQIDQVICREEMKSAMEMNSKRSD